MCQRWLAVPYHIAFHEKVRLWEKGSVRGVVVTGHGEEAGLVVMITLEQVINSRRACYCLEFKSRLRSSNAGELFHVMYQDYSLIHFYKLEC